MIMLLFLNCYFLTLLFFFSLLLLFNVIKGQGTKGCSLFESIMWNMKDIIMHLISFLHVIIIVKNRVKSKKSNPLGLFINQYWFWHTYVLRIAYRSKLLLWLSDWVKTWIRTPARGEKFLMSIPSLRMNCHPWPLIRLDWSLLGIALELTQYANISMKIRLCYTASNTLKKPGICVMLLGVQKIECTNYKQLITNNPIMLFETERKLVPPRPRDVLKTERFPRLRRSPTSGKETNFGRNHRGKLENR